MKNISKKNKYILIILTIISLIIRFIFRNGESGDYLTFLKPWVEQIRDLGYFKSLKYSIGNYNVPYVFILTIISIFKIKPLYLIKFVSIIFDFVSALYGGKIVYKLIKKINISIVTYLILIFLPNAIINSSIWGQCDSIYTAFSLISLYYLLDKKYIPSFIFFGISFSFKLQAIFLLPLFVIMLFKETKIHIYHFLIIPLTNVIMCLPAIIMGRDIKNVLTIYLNQTSEYHCLTMNFPNLYMFYGDAYYCEESYLLSRIGILITLLIFVSMLLFILIKRINITDKKILLLGIWSILISTFFLPHMHERYMFTAELLSVIYFIIYMERFDIPIVINVVTSIMYFYCLFGLEIVNIKLLSFIYFIFIILFNVYVYKTVGYKNENNNKRKI